VPNLSGGAATIPVAGPVISSVTVVEWELRAAFARHETLAPDPGPVRAAIAAAVARRRRLVRWVRGGRAA
jgi:hypothetical protein